MDSIIIFIIAIGIVAFLYLSLLVYEKVKEYLAEKKHIKNEPFNYDLFNDLNEKTFGDLL